MSDAIDNAVSAEFMRRFNERGERLDAYRFVLDAAAKKDDESQKTISTLIAANAALRADKENLIALLKQAEWKGHNQVCIWCRPNGRFQGHALGCPYAAAIDAAREKEG
jgi:hypothetical protein